MAFKLESSVFHTKTTGEATPTLHHRNSWWSCLCACLKFLLVEYLENLPTERLYQDSHSTGSLNSLYSHTQNYATDIWTLDIILWLAERPEKNKSPNSALRVSGNSWNLNIEFWEFNFYQPLNQFNPKHDHQSLTAAILHQNIERGSCWTAKLK